jgi:CheY-like chemotaxis protein
VRQRERAAAEPAPTGPHLLVVDDDPGVLTMLDTGLRLHGFDVTTAGGGRAAVELFRRHAAAIALVLLDVRMPDLDGPRTLAALREVDPHVRCCFMSGDRGSYSPEQLLAMGAARVLDKPFAGLDQLAGTLREVAG